MGFDFRTSRREADKLAAQRRREIREDYRARVEELDSEPGTEYHALELANLRRGRDMELAEVEVEEVHVPGHLSPKEQVFWALCYQVIGG